MHIINKQHSFWNTVCLNAKAVKDTLLSVPKNLFLKFSKKLNWYASCSYPCYTVSDISKTIQNFLDCYYIFWKYLFDCSVS